VTVTLRDAVSGLDLARLKIREETTRLQPQRDSHMGRALPLRDRHMHGLFLLQGMGSMEFSPDGRLLFIAAEQVQMCELASGRVLWTRGGNHALARFSPDGRTLIVSKPGGSIEALDARTGKVRREWQPGVAPQLSLMSPDGRWLATAHSDTTVLLWDLRDVTRLSDDVKPASAEEFPRLWGDLAADAPARAYPAMQRLAASPGAVAFLRKELRPEDPATEERLKKLVENLDSRRFPVREAAMKELKSLGITARPILTDVLTNKPTLEVRRRVEALLSQVTIPDRLVPPGEPLRRYRAVEVLERMGTREAHSVLESLASGQAHGLTTSQAKAALQRLKQ
jgi:hypothetical protein